MISENNAIFFFSENKNNSIFLKMKIIQSYEVMSDNSSIFLFEI